MCSSSCLLRFPSFSEHIHISFKYIFTLFPVTPPLSKSIFDSLLKILHTGLCVLLYEAVLDKHLNKIRLRGNRFIQASEIMDSWSRTGGSDHLGLNPSSTPYTLCCFMQLLCASVSLFTEGANDSTYFMGSLHRLSEMIYGKHFTCCLTSDKLCQLLLLCTFSWRRGVVSSAVHLD